jgi:hypothetical protein
MYRLNYRHLLTSRGEPLQAWLVMSSMRPVVLMSILLVALGGCSVITDRSSLGRGDYVALSCDQLGQEAVRLMREILDRSQHILDDDQDRRDNARQQLNLVKQVSAEKRCNI